MQCFILELPDEIVDRIIAHLPVRDLPSLSLACHRLYNISVPHYYSLVSISCLPGVGTSEIYNQRRSIIVMEALRLNQRKRNGVKRLELRDLHPPVIPVEQERSIYIKPFPVHISSNQGEWGRSLPRYIQLVYDLLCLDFPNLVTLVFDMQGLKRYDDFLRLIFFLKKHTQIKTLEIEHDEWMWAEGFMFPKDLPVFTLAYLEELTIPGHLLSSFVTYLSNPCSLRRVHLWWMMFTSDVSVTRSMHDTLGILADISGNTLLSLQITVPNNSAAVDAIEIIADEFPRLTNLVFCSMRKVHKAILSDMDLMLSQITRLGHLRRFAYTFITIGDRQSKSETYKEDSEAWNYVVDYVVKNCPSIDVLDLGTVEWSRRKN